MDTPRIAVCVHVLKQVKEVSKMSLAFYSQGGIAYNVIALTSTTRQTLLSQRRFKDSPFSKPCESGLSFYVALGLMR